MNIRDLDREKSICSDYGKLKSGQEVKTILNKYDISSARLYQILKRNGVVTRFRKISKGGEQ